MASQIKDELFANDETIGQKIKIKGRNFKVIGILSSKGQSSFLNFDDAAIVPYTTAQQYIFGIKYFHRLVVETDSEANVARTVEDIKITLRNSHNITDPSKDDFFVETQAEALKMVSAITDIFTLFLAAIAAISLFVGGIGIMNIMLVSVTERTREIGLRKALGATGKNIMTQSKSSIEVIIDYDWHETAVCYMDNQASKPDELRTENFDSPGFYCLSAYLFDSTDVKLDRLSIFQKLEL